MQVDLCDLSMSFGDHRVFAGLNWRIPEHRISCLTGSSGCGKTTLLKILAGLLQPSGGELIPPPAGRVSYLFQDALLLPWLTVQENVQYLMDHIPSARRKRDLARELIRRVGLEGFEAYLPRELSGGMARRAAFARMLGKKSSLILMDEPFASLDQERKNGLIDLMKELLREERRTVLCITHDLTAAARFADAVYSFAELSSSGGSG